MEANKTNFAIAKSSNLGYNESAILQLSMVKVF